MGNGEPPSYPLFSREPPFAPSPGRREGPALLICFFCGFHRGQNQRKRREKKKKKKWNGYQNDMAELDAFPKDHQHNRDEESYYGRHGGKGPDSFGIPDIGRFPTAGAPVFSIFMNTPGLQIGHSLFASRGKTAIDFSYSIIPSGSSVPFQVPIRLVSVVLNNPSVSIGWKRKSD